MILRDKAQRQENELEKERQASQARLRALEEQVRQGKIKKQEEKRRKQAAEKEAKERESKLAAQRAELEQAKEKERQLQLQLENIGDEDSSDDEGSQANTPQDNTPTSSQFLSRDGSQQPPEQTQSLPTASESVITSPPPDPQPFPSAPSVPPSIAPSASQRSSFSTESKNPYFKRMSQPAESAAAAPLVSTPSAGNESTNPFHRLAQQQETSNSQALPPLVSTPTGTRPSRARPEEDEWSVVDSTSSSDDEEGPENPTGGSAKQLASMLFGTMAPPRSLSAMDEKTSIDSPLSPPGSTLAPLSPPPPPMPGNFDTGDNGLPATSPPPSPPLPLPAVHQHPRLHLQT